MRRESSADTGCRGGVVQLFSCSRGLPTPPGGRPVDHAQHGADREVVADLDPWLELLPCPAVHPVLASLATLPMAHEDGATAAIQIAFLNGERFADPQSSTPEQHDQRPEAMASSTDSMNPPWVG